MLKIALTKVNLPLMAILALAGLFRFAFFDLLRYDLDNAYPTAQAVQMLEGQGFPLLSLQTSVTLPNPPLMSYLQAIPLAFSRSPYAPLLWVSGLNLLVVPMVYWMGKRHFDGRVALAASLAAGASPWLVFFSRLTWVQGLLPFFASLSALLLLSAVEKSERRGRWLVLGLIALSLGAQTFLLAYGLFLTAGLMVVFFHRHLPPRATAAGWIGAALICVPYGVGLLRDGQTTTKAVSHLNRAQWQVDGEALEHALRLIDGNEFSLARTSEFESDLVLRRTVEGWTHLVFVGLLALGVYWSLRAILKREQGWNASLLVLIWFFAPVALMTWHPFPVHPHYALLTVPAGYLIVGRGVAALFNVRYLKGPILLGAVLFVAISGLNLLRFFQLIESQPDLGHLYWLPLRYSAPMGREITAVVDRWGVTEVYSELDEAELIALSGRTLRSYQAFDPAGFVVVPEGRAALYVLLSQEVGPAFAHAHREGSLSIPPPGGREVDFYVFPARSRQELVRLPTRRLEVSFDNGFRLLGYDLPQAAQPGDFLLITTYWLVERLHQDRFQQYYGPFYHLVDSEGRQLSVGGGGGAPGYQWRGGDLYVATGPLLIPESLASGTYWINAGLYDPNAHRNARILDSQGNPWADKIRLGPIGIEDASA